MIIPCFLNNIGVDPNNGVAVATFTPAPDPKDAKGPAFPRVDQVRVLFENAEGLEKAGYRLGGLHDLTLKPCG